jgi:hypothetical protein
MGAKMWWRWLQHPTELWAQIWKQKYAPNTHADQLIRFNDHIQGSNIWNTTWQNRPLIQRHAFWEVRNGESALFWQDSWQQLSPLCDLEDLNPLKQNLHPNIFQRVRDLWNLTHRNQPWRQWKIERTELQLTEDTDLQAWQDCVAHRKIPIKNGPNILRWRHSTTSIFSVNEAYYLEGNYQNQAREIIRSKIWKGILWPKVSIFLWLTAQNRILTWDNLLKRGFIGPSRCTLCHQRE